MLANHTRSLSAAPCVAFLFPAPTLRERRHRAVAHFAMFRGLDRPHREIDAGYRCDLTDPSIVLIGQCEFSGIGRSKDCRYCLACEVAAAKRPS
jgi:hypothetical protein